MVGFPGGAAGKKSTYNTGNLGSIPDWKDSLTRERLLHPVFQPEKSMDYTVHGAAKVDRTERFHYFFTLAGSSALGQVLQERTAEYFTNCYKRRNFKSSRVYV